MDLLSELKTERKFLTISLAYFGGKFVDELDAQLNSDIDIVRFDNLSSLKSYIFEQPSVLSAPDILIMEVEDDLAEAHLLLQEMRQNVVTKAMAVIILGFKNNKPKLINAFSDRVNDIYMYPFNVENIEKRLMFICKFKLLGERSLKVDHRKVLGDYKQPPLKRLFDILVSGTLLVILLPLLLLIAFLIKIDSKGPIIYKSKRAGTGYRIFNFYKFRSMRVNADKELSSFAALNQYGSKGNQSAFIKIKRDPRITRFGSFLRNTSLDELPQLFNVLLGDMSMVGNRPLPLYEAQLLTSDEWSMRFLGPAGITGLWQVSKRGKEEMSDVERRQLDNQYAAYYSFWLDLKIMLMTIPAMIQRERV